MDNEIKKPEPPEDRHINQAKVPEKPKVDKEVMKEKIAEKEKLLSEKKIIEK